MYPVAFEHVSPDSVDAACRELAADPAGTRVLAGGQSLLPQLNLRLQRPRRLVDISRIAGLHTLHADADGLHVGAGITQRAVESWAGLAAFRLLAQALPRVGTVPTRNRGTVCGSLAHADPAAEIGVCLLAGGGFVTAVGSGGRRRIAAENFFRGPYLTALSPGELLESTTFHRLPTGAVGYFDEVTLRGVGDTPLVSAAVTGRVDHGRATDVRIVVGGAGQPPTLLAAGDVSSVEDCAAEVTSSLSFTGDARCSGEHRRRVARRLVARLLHRLCEANP